MARNTSADLAYNGTFITGFVAARAPNPTCNFLWEKLRQTVSLWIRAIILEIRPVFCCTTLDDQRGF
jgi:hypothetical protein